jgi:Superinfection immunity protein
MLYEIVAATTSQPDEYTATETAVAVAIWLTILAILWLLPTIVAVRRHVRHVGSIAVINIFLGWTFIGWVAALALATRTVESPSRREHKQRNDVG